MNRSNYEKYTEKGVILSTLRNMDYDRHYSTDESWRIYSECAYENELQRLKRKGYRLVRDDTGDIIDIEKDS